LAASGWDSSWFVGTARRASSKMVGDEELERLSRVFDRHGLAVVVVTRALPVVMETMSVVAGLSKMNRGSFLIASLLGTAPIVVVYAYAGAVSRETSSLIPAVIMLVAVAGLGWIVYRARLSDADDVRSGDVLERAKSARKGT
jgi:uncharacterized membrane protein YdjX (TVP38/TMEM64 family)